MSKVEGDQIDEPRETLKHLIKGLIGQGEFFVTEAPWSEASSQEYILAYRQQVASKSGGLREGQTVRFTTKIYASAQEGMADFKKLKAEIEKEKSRGEVPNVKS